MDLDRLKILVEEIVENSYQEVLVDGEPIDGMSVAYFLRYCRICHKQYEPNSKHENDCPVTLLRELIEEELTNGYT